MHKYYISFNHTKILETILNKYERNGPGLSINILIMYKWVLFNSSVYWKTFLKLGYKRKLRENMYLLSTAFITNYHKVHGFKHHQFIMSWISRSKIHMESAVPSAPVPQAVSKCQPELWCDSLSYLSGGSFKWLAEFISL